MSTTDTQTHHYFHFSEINEVYLSHATRALGFALVGIFVPIYLYELGYSLVIIGLILASTHAVRAGVIPIAARFIARIGPKHVIALSQVFGILFIIALTFAEAGRWAVILAMVLRGFNAGLFWIANHYNLTYARNNEKTSSQVGWLYIVLTSTQALGPLIGGIIATQLNIAYTLAAAAFFLVLSGAALLQTKEQAPKASFRWSDAIRGWRDMTGGAIANFSGSLEKKISKHVWALFIFLFLGTYQAVGLVASLSLVVSLAVTYIVGQRGDNGKNFQQIYFGTRGKALVNIARPFVSTFFGAALVNAFSDVISKFYKVPFLAYYYEVASQKKRRLAYITKFELAGSAGDALAWLLLSVAALMLPVSFAFTALFGIAALAILFKTSIVPSSQH